MAVSYRVDGGYAQELNNGTPTGRWVSTSSSDYRTWAAAHPTATQTTSHTTSTTQPSYVDQAHGTTTYVRPTRGASRYGSEFGLWSYGPSSAAQKTASQTPGSGLWQYGIDPNSPTLEQDVENWLKKFQYARNQRTGGYNFPELTQATFGREDARVPGLSTLRAKYPNMPLSVLLDTARRSAVGQSALPPRTFDIMQIVDPIIEFGLGWAGGPIWGTALATLYGGGRAAGEGADLLGVALGAGGGYLGGSSGAGFGANVAASGGVRSYLSSLPKELANTAKYGFELNSVNAAVPSAAAGALAGASNAMRANPAALSSLVHTASQTGANAAGTAASGVPSGGGTGMGAFTDWLSQGNNALTAATVVGNIYSANKTADAIAQASQAQQQAANQSNMLQQGMYQQQAELQRPFREAGVAATNRMLDLLGLSSNRNAQGYGSLGHNFTMADFQKDPGYAFRLNEGLKALERTAAARGGLMSGAAGKAAQRYGQGMASDEYMNAFNRYQTGRSNLLNPLQSLAGTGLTSANTIASVGQNTAQQQSQALADAAQARASGYIGTQNAWNQALNNTLNTVQQNYLTNRLFPNG